MWICWKCEQGPLNFTHLVYITMESDLDMAVQSNLSAITFVVPFITWNKKT